MNATRSRRTLLAACCAALAALTLAATGATAAKAGAAAAASAHGGGPIVTTDDGAVRGVVVPGGYTFRGLPYAAPPTGNLRWRPRPHQPTGTGSAMPPNSRQAARSRCRTHPCRPARSARTACTST